MFEKRKAKMKIQCLILAGVFVLSVLLIGCGGKAGVKKLIGKWEMYDGEDGVYEECVLEFYEPKESGDSNGDLEYVYDSGDTEWGKYEYNEESKLLVLTYTDGVWGTEESIAFGVEFVSGDTVQLMSDGNPYMELRRVD